MHNVYYIYIHILRNLKEWCLQKLDHRQLRTSFWLKSARPGEASCSQFLLFQFLFFVSKLEENMDVGQNGRPRGPQMLV